MLKQLCIYLSLTFLITLSSTIFAKEVAAPVEDKYLWLEDIDGDKALAWVDQTNKTTTQSIAKNADTQKLYEELYRDALSALNSKDKLPDITQRGDWIYYLHKDAEHARGNYQRTQVVDFKKGKPQWETVLDIDAMSLTDDIKWVFQGMDCLKPDYIKCLVSLSPGGGDAHVLKEFDTRTLKFVEDGFNLPKSKMTVTWVDEDHLFVATNFGEGSMTESGYARMVKLWQRGTPLEKAHLVMQTNPKSVAIYANRYRDDKGDIDMIFESIDYWSNRYYQYIDGKPIHLNLPESAVVKDVINAQLVVSLQQDWSFNGQDYKQGSILLVDPHRLHSHSANETKNKKDSITLLLESTPSAIVEDVTVSKGSILVVVLEDVKSRVYRYQQKDEIWHASPIEFPTSGQIFIQTVNDTSGEFFARYEDFLTPPTLYSVDPSLKVEVALQQSATFDSKPYKVEQYFTKSKDGTKVPYFAIMHKDAVFNGNNPTHIFAYGGFRASLTPSYSGSYEDHNGAYGKAWLERGGIYVLANIRGGGEYGPAWHAAALLENRNKAFEDFEAIAQDLIERKITSPKHLGIEGRSNGGLLVGATMIRRPDLYGAIICGVPLLDMQRYHKLLAGSSWMAEYGDPSTDDWRFIKEYSPYQNLQQEQDYPPVFFFTSTRDDRVHPGHARKMAAKMMQFGHKIDYFENTEGGHKGSVTSEQLAKRIALSFTHLWQHLK